jgi:hypothetical protein
VELFCGIDWAESHHDVAIVNENGQMVAKGRIADDPAGFAELIEMLTAAGDQAQDPVPVAIETPRGLLVASLRATGRPVYAINPLAVARYRERHSVARAKSDHADAMTLANILRVDAHLHRRLPADTELCQAIAVLARAHQDAIWRRTKAHNELRSMLREYYPTFLAAFTSRFALGIASAEARAVLAIAPTPAAAAKLSVSRSPPRCAVTVVAVSSTAPPPTSKQPCGNRNCDNHFVSRRRWVVKPSPCWLPLTRPAAASTTSARHRPSCFRPIPTTRSSSASPGWPTPPVHACSPRSATTAPASPTPGPSRPTPAPHPSPEPRADPSR